MFTTASWGWLVRMMGESSFLKSIIRGRPIMKLTFTTPTGQEITIPHGSRVTLWLGR